ncbi:hypothetical protein D9M71_169740 [compost metagenome]
MGQAVGAAVELLVTEVVFTQGQGDGIRSARGLGFDGAVQHLGIGVFDPGWIPVADILRLLVATEQRQFGDALPRACDDALQQLLPMACQAFDGVDVEQVGGIGPGGDQAFFGIEGVKRQVELGGRVVPVQVLHLQRHARVERRLLGAALVVVHYLEQRVVAQAALRMQGFDQLLEGQVLMGLGVKGVLLDLVQDVEERGLAIELAAQYLGVDEKTQ